MGPSTPLRPPEAPTRGRRGHGPGDGPPTARAGAHEPRRRRAAPAGASRTEPLQGGAPPGARGPEAPTPGEGGAEPPPGPRRGPVLYLILGQYSVSREVG